MSSYDELMGKVNRRAEARRASDRAVAKATRQTIEEFDADATAPDPRTEDEPLPKPTRWHSAHRASQIADQLSSGEFSKATAWTYEVVLDDKDDDYAAVAVFDETGEFVTYWN